MKTHGLMFVNGKRRPEYSIWYGMKKRCIDPASPNYRYYGGRGITVCERWLYFENFFEDMGERPSSKHSLDRYPNNDGNYEPGNVRWATAYEQSLNRRTNCIIEFNGVKKPLAAWSKEYGIHEDTLFRRLFRSRWDVEKCLLTPPMKKEGTGIIEQIRTYFENAEWGYKFTWPADGKRYGDKYTTPKLLAKEIGCVLTSIYLPLKQLQKEKFLTFSNRLVAYERELIDTDKQK